MYSRFFDQNHSKGKVILLISVLLYQGIFYTKFSGKTLLTFGGMEVELPDWLYVLLTTFLLLVNLNAIFKYYQEVDSSPRSRFFPCILFLAFYYSLPDSEMTFYALIALPLIDWSMKRAINERNRYDKVHGFETGLAVALAALVIPSLILVYIPAIWLLAIIKTSNWRLIVSTLIPIPMVIVLHMAVVSFFLQENTFENYRLFREMEYLTFSYDYENNFLFFLILALSIQPFFKSFSLTSSLSIKHRLSLRANLFYSIMILTALVISHNTFPSLVWMVAPFLAPTISLGLENKNNKRVTEIIFTIIWITPLISLLAF